MALTGTRIGCLAALALLPSAGAVAFLALLADMLRNSVARCVPNFRGLLECNDALELAEHMLLASVSISRSGSALVDGRVTR